MASISKTVRPKRSNNNAVSPTGYGLTVGRGTPTISVPGSGGLYPNKPGNYTLLREIDFSQSVPATDGVNSKPIAGASGWYTTADSAAPTSPPASNFSQITDGNEPLSPSSAWRLSMQAGTYANSHGYGNLWTALPGSTGKLYIAYTCRWNTGYLWHGISNKHINIFTQTGVFLVQSYEGGSTWMRAHDLTSPDTLHPLLSTTSISLGVWHFHEILIERGNPGTVRIWRDGVLSTNSTALPVPEYMTEFGIFGYRGGGGETLAADISYDLGHVYLATAP